ncbi:thioredoxin fold domain-containing protein [Haliea sp. E17]|uniref:thioredoxin fold domain-containing protein n=1 Tax=Haliea sp. E17 TaxID=3401576 RepID=UPI003AADF20E
MFKTVTAGLLLASASVVLAADGVDEAVEAHLRKALTNPGMNLTVESVAASEVPGMYAVQFENGPLVYATEDGNYLIHGDLFRVTGGQYVNLSEKQRDLERKELMDAVNTDDMIVFAAEGETRAYINVFTDVTCFYCQKLHKEVPELNKRGVEVRYLAFPRAGLGSASYDLLVTAWCSDDQQSALTKLKNKENVPSVTCDNNPVKTDYELGQRVGVRGTPALVTAEGRLIPGYQTVDQLMATLGLD